LQRRNSAGRRDASFLDRLSFQEIQDIINKKGRPEYCFEEGDDPDEKAGCSLYEVDKSPQKAKAINNGARMIAPGTCC